MPTGWREGGHFSVNGCIYMFLNEKLVHKLLRKLSDFLLVLSKIGKIGSKENNTLLLTSNRQLMSKRTPS